MNYKDDFFDAYRKYLDIPEVVQAHRQVFATFRHLMGVDQDVTDLGCGTAEFGRYMHLAGWKNRYRGFDLDITRVDCRHENASFRVGDYRDHKASDGEIIVSMFATDIHMLWDDHEAMYDRWFQEGARAMLIAGFYYVGREDDLTVTETTGYTVYQTVPVCPINTKYSEMRISQQVPAGMFVNPFVEVWRILHQPRSITGFLDGIRGNMGELG